MTNLNIRRIETFLAVTACGSFRRAAEQLNRSQSAVSAHIGQLEQELGVPLLNRTTRRVSLTAAGKTFSARCKDVLADLENVANELQEEAQIKRGRVSLGSAPSVSTNFLPRIIAAYQARYPGVALRLHEDFARQMYDRLRDEETDFAIGPKLERLEDFDFERILTDPIVAVLPSSHPLAGRREIGLEEVARQPLLTVPRGTAIRAVIEDAFQARGLLLSPRFEVVHQQTLLNMVEAELGITILPALSVPFPREGRYRVAQLTEPAIVREVSVITLKGRMLSPPARRCAELAKQMIRSKAEAQRVQHAGTKRP
jgi:LysR family carnitine catabolism transcriptional activator